MTMFSSTASHDQRWNVPAGCHFDSTRFIDRSNAAALIRSRWLSDGTRRSHLLVDRNHLTPRVPQTHTKVSTDTLVQYFASIPLV